MIVRRLLLLCLWVAPAWAEQAPHIGVLAALEGTVTIIHAGLARVAQAQESISLGDSVQTGADGTVEIHLQDQTTLFLRPRSLLHLVSFAPPIPGQTPRTLSEAALEKGKMVVRTGTAPVAVTTPTAVVRAAHTRFAVEVR